MKESFPRILIADDNADLLRGLSLRLRSHFDVHTASSVSQAKALASRNEYDAAIIDLCFEGQELDGNHLIDHLNRESPGTYLIVLSGDSSVKRVVEAMRRSLFDFIHKDGEFFDSLLAALNRAVQLKCSRNAEMTQKYLTDSSATQEVLRKADRILRSLSDASILILGETGSGKEFLAQHIALGMKKRLVSANMAGIPMETAESILFGHIRGAFTGATENRIGLIESANNGIFFLDEVGECSPAVQAKLLRVLQEKEVQQLGANVARSIRVQFIAATHRNLEEMVAAGTFRLDLLQRLNTFVLRLPPLRERPEDILLYTNLFIDQMVDANPRLSLTQEGIQTLISYPWPGNIRELRSVIQRIAILSDKRIIDGQTVIEAIQMGSEKTTLRVSNRVEVLKNDLRRDELLNTLRANHGNKRLSARALKISEATLYRWVQEFRLKPLVDRLRQGHYASEELAQ